MKDQVQDSSQINLPSHLRVRKSLAVGRCSLLGRVQTGLKGGGIQYSSILEDSSLARAFEFIYDPEFPDTSHFRSGRGCRDESRTFSFLTLAFTWLSLSLSTLGIV
ncbi:hypothetical protein Tco_1275344 [Tanacetum coccineum]